MAWRRQGDKPLSKTVMVSLLTHLCVTRPQWFQQWVTDHLISISQVIEYIFEVICMPSLEQRCFIKFQAIHVWPNSLWDSAPRVIWHRAVSPMVRSAMFTQEVLAMVKLCSLHVTLLVLRMRVMYIFTCLVMTGFWHFVKLKCTSSRVRFMQNSWFLSSKMQ